MVEGLISCSLCFKKCNFVVIRLKKKVRTIVGKRVLNCSYREPRTGKTTSILVDSDYKDVIPQ